MNESNKHLIKSFKVPEKKSEKANYPRKQTRQPSHILVKSTMTIKREDTVLWHGWGFKDSRSYIKDKVAYILGDRYPVSGHEMPYVYDYMILLNDSNVELKESYFNIEPKLPKENEVDASIIPDAFVQEMKDLDILCSKKASDRYTRCQGQGSEEVINFKLKLITRIPDCVVWPTCHEDVEKVVAIADQMNVVIIPFGGGTSVGGQANCPKNEKRPIVSLDMTLMNEILWVDKENMTYCCEAGIIGADLERELNKIGFTCGHEPDSIEFSTVGGWVSTRASGMKKNKYGNIEGIVLGTRVVTPRGVLQHQNVCPRSSSGPDHNHIVMGSEGMLGVITEVVMKMFEIPEVQHYGCILFPEFHIGIDFLREVAKRRLQPASIRLLDNAQFTLGMALKPRMGYLEEIIEYLKFAYLEKVKGYHFMEMCTCTMKFEGKKDEVAKHDKLLHEIASRYKGLRLGETIGKRGYQMTFAIGYLRDMSLIMNVGGGTMESSLPWPAVHGCVKALYQVNIEETARMGILPAGMMIRIAQTYDSGAVVYLLYSVFCSLAKMPEIITHLDSVFRNVAIARGGCISHHHGIGKHRQAFYEDFVSPIGRKMFLAIKKEADPNNIFASGNITATNY